MNGKRKGWPRPPARALFSLNPFTRAHALSLLSLSISVITGLVLMQIVMTGYLSVKKSTSAILTLILIPLTLIARSACLDVFRRPLAAMSLRAAVDMDAADAAGGVGGAFGGGGEVAAVGEPVAGAGGKTFSPYLSPAMRFDGSDLPALKAEAAEVKAYLSGSKAPPPVEDNVAEEAAREAVAAKQHALRAESKRVSSKEAAPTPKKPAAVAKAKSGRAAPPPAVAAPAVPAGPPTAGAGPATTYEEAIRRANSGRASASGEV